MQPKTCGATFAHSPHALLVTHSSPLLFREERSILDTSSFFCNSTSNTKSIYILRHNFRHNLRAKKLFSKKIHLRGITSKYCTSRVLYIPFYPPKSPTFGAKPLPRRRFLQHYYRDTFIESHRKPIDIPQISYGGPETYRELKKKKNMIKTERGLHYS